MAPAATSAAPKSEAFTNKEEPAEVRSSNIVAAKAVSDAVRTSLGPKGMDKMIQSGNGEVVITNAGATILKQMSVLHPAAKMMDKILKEERTYLLNMCKQIKKSGCNVLLIQKSILRDAVNDLSLHFLAKLKILAIKEIERDEVEFICKSTGCKPIADIDSFTEDKLGYADVVEEVTTAGANVVKIMGLQNSGKTVSVLIHGANKLVLEEAERSLHDALCVIRCLVKKRALIAGGGAPEIHVSQRLLEFSKTLKGMEAYCFSAFAEALEVIPTTLAENAGLNPIGIVTELRNRHSKGEITAGINVRKGAITNILEENVVQPLLVSTSAIELAAETVKMIMKIDDIVAVR
ncbi:T-complex protein 1 subunit delta [Entophlyctis sp. JEL0112]|nr:T-complex protein 1 subunit delta [Entophlyctis sp. JEL0112]